jgi:hypothetical protein
MSCNQNCNQGRNCNCNGTNNRASDRAVVIVATLLFIAVVSMGYGVYKLFHANKGQDCAVEVQFGGGVKATYLGTSV